MDELLIAPFTAGAKKGHGMEESTEITQTMHRFFDRLSGKDVTAFYELVELSEATMVLGTAPGEIVREEERLRFGFEFEGFTVEPGLGHGAGRKAVWVGTSESP